MKQFTTNLQNDFIKSQGTHYLLNCGSLENLHRYSNFLPIFSDGFCLQYKHILAPNVTLKCKYLLSEVLPSGFRMGCVLRPEMTGHDTPEMEVDVDPVSKTTNLSVQYHPISAIRLCLSAQFFPKATIQNGRVRRVWTEKINLSSDYYSRNATTTISLHNWKNYCTRLAIAHLKSYSSRIAFGFELLTEWENYKFNELIPSIGGRYLLDDVCYAATISTRGLDFTFWRLVNNDNQFGCSLLYKHENQSCLGNIYYQKLFKNDCIRALINSNSAIGLTYSSRYYDFVECNVELSLLHCLPTRKFSLGVKFEFETHG